MFETATELFLRRQGEIVSALTQCDGTGSFEVTEWDRPGEGNAGGG